MHEYSLMEDVLASVTGDLARRGITDPATIKEIVLRIGALDIHSEESFALAFTALAKETVLREATLTLHVIPSRIECPQCGYQGDCLDTLDGHDPHPMVACPRCGTVAIVVGGRGLEPIKVILEDDDKG